LETKKEHLQRLLQSGNWTAQDKIWLSEYLDQDDLSMLSDIALDQYNDDLLNQVKHLDQVTSAQLLSGIHKRMRIVGQVKKVSLWPRIAAAAAILLVVGAGLWYYNANIAHPVVGSGDLVKNDIGPGKHTATLTLGNGEKIVLGATADGELAKEAGVSITKTADGQVIYNVIPTTDAAGSSTEEKGHLLHYNTLSTAKGESYQIVLPDGTKVWLNAASSLTYSATLNVDGERRVNLDGEAYFEVAKLRRGDQTSNDHIPFVVSSKGQEVTVLGTHFNIDSYADEGSTRTTLLEGVVRVASPAGNDVVLKPGEQSALWNNDIKVMQVDTDEMIAWKNGYFKFVDEDMQSIMRKISRWYNVDVQYSGNITKEVFSGRISRSKNISQVLKVIESANSVHFKVEGRRVTVIK
jgi:transmembrane sensor